MSQNDTEEEDKTVETEEEENEFAQFADDDSSNEDNDDDNDPSEDEEGEEVDDENSNDDEDEDEEGEVDEDLLELLEEYGLTAEHVEGKSEKEIEGILSLIDQAAIAKSKGKKEDEPTKKEDQEQENIYKVFDDIETMMQAEEEPKMKDVLKLLSEGLKPLLGKFGDAIDYAASNVYTIKQREDEKRKNEVAQGVAEVFKDLPEDVFGSEDSVTRLQEKKRDDLLDHAVTLAKGYQSRNKAVPDIKSLLNRAYRSLYSDDNKRIKTNTDNKSSGRIKSSFIKKNKKSQPAKNSDKENLMLWEKVAAGEIR